jgi:2-keto-4-pentenoate hydratase/2-oxohepta-3-ene-1,7-dioic acid hydratase in catechol pathway
MRYLTFEHDGRSRCGILRENEVYPFREALTSMSDYLALNAEQRDGEKTDSPIPLDRISPLAPVRPHKNVFCVGRNYLGHAEEIARARGTELKLPPVPTFFTKAPTAIANPGATLTLDPKLSTEYDWEAELAVVIGTRCRDVAEADALGVVFGYTALNDLTARDLQREHQQWFKGKSLDDACPIGPWIVDAAEIEDPQTLHVSLRVNGVEKQSSSTSNMIFSVARIIASLSAGMTLEPGDVIATGTPDGVGFARTPPEFLTNGDVVEVEIDRIGVLRNTIAFL